MAGAERGTRGDDILQIAVIPKEDLVYADQALAAFRVLERMEGSAELTSEKALLEQFDRSKWPLQLPRTLPELEALRASPAGKTISVFWRSLLPAVQAKDAALRVSARHLQYELTGQSNTVPLMPGRTYRVAFELAVRRGGVAINVMSPDLRQYRYQMLRRYPQRGWRRQ